MVIMLYLTSTLERARVWRAITFGPIRILWLAFVLAHDELDAVHKALEYEFVVLVSAQRRKYIETLLIDGKLRSVWKPLEFVKRKRHCQDCAE